jgi:hypothetical protein
MPYIPKIPDSCIDLDLVLVERVLTKRLGDIHVAARELGVSGPDLRRLTWAKPHLLDGAHEAIAEIFARGHGVGFSICETCFRVAGTPDEVTEMVHEAIGGTAALVSRTN